jgi:hypothetical protein
MPELKLIGQAVAAFCLWAERLPEPAVQTSLKIVSCRILWTCSVELLVRCFFCPDLTMAVKEAEKP